MGRATYRIVPLMEIVSCTKDSNFDLKVPEGYCCTIFLDVIETCYNVPNGAGTRDR